MKTTELLLEQVLIGFIVLLIGVVPFHPELLPLIDGSTLWKSVAAGAAAVGAAYLLGMLFDRFADTLLEGLDRHNRLRFALKPVTAFPVTWQDPFPEHRLRIRALCAGGAIAEWLEYLRSRIRLLRGLAVFLPGLTFAVVLAFGRITAPPRPWQWLLLVVPVCYLIGPLLETLLASREPFKRFQAPRTDSETSVKRYAQRRGLAGTAASTTLSLGIDFLLTPGVWSLIALSTAAIACSLLIGAPAVISALTGTTLTTLSLWAWWRISKTNMSFLRDFDRHVPISRP